MYETRNQRITKQKAMAKYQSFKRINHSMKKSVAMMGTTVMMGLYVSPVAQVLTSQKAEAASVGLTNNQFINTLIPSAQKVTKGKNLYTSVMLAQAALETGMGNSTLSKAPNHNLFGIKGDYQGESVNMATLEDSGDQNYYQINANFRKYPSYEQSLEDYTKVLLNGPAFDHQYYAGAWKSNTTSYKDATAHLTGRYATDSAYGSKLNRIIEKFDLTRYDGDSVVDPALVEQINNEIAKANYTVVAKDTLYGISRKTGVSVAELLSLNGITLDTVIYPGQNLKIPVQEVSQPKDDDRSTIIEDTVVEDDAVLVTPVEDIKEEVKPIEVKPIEVATKNQYTIVSGDTLYKISRKTGTPVKELLRLNNLTMDTIIYPGQKLTVANEEIKEVTPTPQPQPQPQPTPVIVTPMEEVKEESQPIEVTPTNQYTIVAGDTLYGISRKTGISLKTLLALNNLAEDSVIYPGETLKTTGGQTVANKPVAETTTAKTYTIKAGDSLWRIAKNNGLSLDKLKSLNGLTSNIITPNQVLKLA